jgi:ADP-heptose:LPS heptosyltransferase
MDKPSAILVTRLKSMGDIVFTLPALHVLRTAAPTARIVFLVSREFSPLLQGYGDVNSVIELDRDDFRGLHPIKTTAVTLSLIRRLRSERFQLAVDFQGYGETALLTWLSGAPTRWGTVYRPGRSWAYTHAVPRHADVHPAQDHLLLLQGLGVTSPAVRNEFVVPQPALTQAEEFLSQNRLRQNERLLFIQPFTSSPQKNWPLARYLELAQHWRGKNWQVLFGGGPGDRGALEPARQAGFAVAAGVPLLVSAGLASFSNLVLGADTGLVHLAVAMGKRVVMIMRSPFSGSTHPFQHPDWAIAPPNKEPVESIRTDLVEQHCANACAQMGLSL